MCLSKVTRSVAKPSKLERWAWKGMRIEDGKLYTGSQERFLPQGRWVRDKAGGRITNHWRGVDYPKGFHVNISRTGAKRWGTPTRVKVRRVHTFGEQNHHKVMVAKEIFIPKPKKGGR